MYKNSRDISLSESTARTHASPYSTGIEETLSGKENRLWRIVLFGSEQASFLSTSNAGSSCIIVSKTEWNVGIMQSTEQICSISTFLVAGLAIFGKSFFDCIIAITSFLSSSEAAGAKPSKRVTDPGSTLPRTRGSRPTRIFVFQTRGTVRSPQVISYLPRVNTCFIKRLPLAYTSSHLDVSSLWRAPRSMRDHRPGTSTTASKGAMKSLFRTNCFRSLCFEWLKQARHLVCSASSSLFNLILRNMSPSDSTCSCLNSPMISFATSPGKSSQMSVFD